MLHIPDQKPLSMSEHIDIDLYQPLHRGFRARGLTDDDIAHHLKNAGGPSEADSKWWAAVRKQFKVSAPPRSDECVCGHKIIKQKYVFCTRTKEVFVCGSSCVKSFLPEEARGKWCLLCQKAHQNRTTDLCNECRVDHCDECFRPVNPAYSHCYTCNLKSMHPDDATAVAKPTYLRKSARNAGRTYLNVPYAEKDEAKRMGARWDPQRRRWYARKGHSSEKALLERRPTWKPSR